jgi:hypothetical protein
LLLCRPGSNLAARSFEGSARVPCSALQSGALGDHNWSRPQCWLKAEMGLGLGLASPRLNFDRPRAQLRLGIPAVADSDEPDRRVPSWVDLVFKNMRSNKNNAEHGRLVRLIGPVEILVGLNLRLREDPSPNCCHVSVRIDARSRCVYSNIWLDRSLLSLFW